MTEIPTLATARLVLRPRQIRRGRRCDHYREKSVGRKSLTVHLAQKLGLKPGATLFTIGAPDDYLAWLAPLPEGLRIVATKPAKPCGMVHLFAATLHDLDLGLPQARRSMATDGAIWVSWLKKAAKIPTDVTEAIVRQRALATDLVDVKICAVSAQWSGLKLVVRKHLRGQGVAGH